MISWCRGKFLLDIKANIWMWFTKIFVDTDSLLLSPLPARTIKIIISTMINTQKRRIVQLMASGGHFLQYELDVPYPGAQSKHRGPEYPVPQGVTPPKVSVVGQASLLAAMSSDEGLDDL
jgi:hypothetical protein